MECLEGYIGIKGCNSPEPLSGLYVNELPGINLKSVVDIADEDQKTYLGVWADVEKRTLRKFSTILTAFFKTRYKLKLLFDRVRIGETLDVSAPIPSANDLRGLQIEINGNSTYPRVSPLVTVCFNNMQYYSTDIKTGAKFYIRNNGVQLKEYTRNLVVGWNSLDFEYCIPASEIIGVMDLVVDANTITETVDTTIGEPTSSGGCCSCCISTCCSGDIKGIVFDNATSVTTYENNNGHGFRGFISMECKYDGLVCANKDLFASALWYMLGEEMMIERIYSDTINKYTTVGKGDAKELRDYYKLQVDAELELVTDIDLNRSDCCLECNDQVLETPTIG